MKESATVWARMCSAALLLLICACSDDNTVDPAPSADALDEENVSGIEGADVEDPEGGDKDAGSASDESAEGGESEAEEDGAGSEGEECADPNCVDENGACIAEGEVNPANGCEVCSEGAFVASDSDCDDGNACTENDSCVDGACVGDAVVCDEPGTCQVGICDPVEGCVYTFEEGLECEDGNACTEGDTCKGLGCSPGSIVVCNDGNECTLDVCDPSEGCTGIPVEDGTPCDDGNQCGFGDTCGEGICKPGPEALMCDDGDPCTLDKCLPAEGCTATISENNTCRPIIDVAFPARGESVVTLDPTSPIVVVGNVSSLAAPITSLSLNGESVDYDENGDFTVEVDATVGGNILVFETENELGWSRRRVQAFHWSTEYILPELVEEEIPEIPCTGEKTNSGCWTAYSTGESAISWADAEANCVAGGGHLASIHGPNENDLVRELADAVCGEGSSVWIGLTDAIVEGSFGWTDSSPLDFAPWADGEPNDFNGAEDVTEMYGSGEWNDSSGAGLGCYACFVPDAPPTPAVLTGLAEPGLGIYLTQEALDDGDNSLPANDFATVLEAVFDAFNLNEIIPNPVAQGVECGGAVYDIYVDNLTNNQPTLGLSCIDGGFEVQADITGIQGDFFADKVGGGFFSPGSLNGTLTLDALAIVADVVLTVNPETNALEANFENISAGIDGIAVDVDGLFGGLIGGALQGTLDSFAGDIETLLVDEIPSVLGPVVGDTLSSLAFEFDLELPSLNPEGEPVAISLKTDFSYTDFAPPGGMIALRAGALTPETVTPYPIVGAPARAGCDGNGEDLIVNGGAPLEVTLTDDAINTILLAAWRGGFVEFVAPESLFGDFDLTAFGITDLEATVSGWLPPSVSSCGPDGTPLITIGDLELLASMNFGGTPLDLVIYASLQAEFNLSAAGGEIGFGLGEVSVVELELTAVQDSQIALEPLVKVLLEEQALPGLLEGLQGDALGGIALPEISLSEDDPELALTIIPLDIVRSGGNSIVLASLDPNDAPEPVEPGEEGGEEGDEAAGGDGGEGNVEEEGEPEPTGACSGASDSGILAEYTPDDLASVGSSCGLSCFFAGNQAQCIGDCYGDELGLTNGCADCFGASGQCAIDNCSSTCAADSQSSGCLSCLENAGCTAAFDTCAYGQ